MEVRTIVHCSACLPICQVCGDIIQKSVKPFTKINALRCAADFHTLSQESFEGDQKELFVGPDSLQREQRRQHLALLDSAVVVGLGCHSIVTEAEADLFVKICLNENWLAGGCFPIDIAVGRWCPK